MWRSRLPLDEVRRRGRRGAGRRGGRAPARGSAGPRRPRPRAAGEARHRRVGRSADRGPHPQAAGAAAQLGPAPSRAPGGCVRDGAGRGPGRDRALRRRRVGAQRALPRRLASGGALHAHRPRRGPDGVGPRDEHVLGDGERQLRRSGPAGAVRDGSGGRLRRVDRGLGAHRRRRDGGPQPDRLLPAVRVRPRALLLGRGARRPQARPAGVERARAPPGGLHARDLRGRARRPRAAGAAQLLLQP